MSEAVKDGGQAFPQPVAISPAGDEHIAYPGMTLRDWFAGQAIGHIIRAASSGQHVAGAVHLPDVDASIERKMAADSYAIADAMIEARSK